MLKSIYRYWDIIAVGIATTIYIVVFSYLSIIRHDAFTTGYDLANMDQTVWNTMFGNFFSLTADSGTVSRLSIHADLLLIFFSPFYLIWDNVKVLLIAQSVALGLGAIPTFLLAKKVLRSRVASVILVLVYLINPNMQWTNMYDFHSVSFAIPLLITAFYAAYTKKWTLFVWSTFFALLTKEQISLYIAIFGMVIAFVFKEKKIGLITATVGCIWFIGSFFIVMPIFSKDGKHWAWDWYGDGHSSAETSYLAVIKHHLAKLTTQDVLIYYADLLKPLGFVPLLGLPWIIMSVPELLINSLSTHAQMRSYQLHYDSGIMPALIIASILGLQYLQRFIYYVNCYYNYSKYIFYFCAVIMLSFTLRYNYYYSPLPLSPNCWCFVYNVTQEDRDFEEALSKIPKEAVVSASPEVRPHITHREFAYTLPVATESADFIAVITQNRMIGDYSDKDFENQLIKVLKQSSDHSVAFSSEHFYLFQRK